MYKTEPGVKVDLGSGTAKPEGYIGVDKRSLPGVDIVHDLDMGLPFQDDHADVVRTHHVLEHLQNPIYIMTEIWRVLKPNGTLEFEVPSTSGKGAFSNPDHHSYWNEDSFQFYCNDTLREQIGFPGKFDIVRLDKRRENGRAYVSGILKAIKPSNENGEATVQPILTEAALRPGSKFKPMKPAMAGYTEAFSVEELKPWFEKHLGSDGSVAVEPKYNGFHTVLQKSGNDIKVWFEDAQSPRELPKVNERLRRLPDFIAVGNVGINREGKPKARVDLNKLTITEEPKLDTNELVLVTLFDLLYYQREDLHNQPWLERRKALERFYNRHLHDSRNFDISPYKKANSLSMVEAATKWAMGIDGSEGAMFKDVQSPYKVIGGASSDWAKVKRMVEIKVIVLKVQDNANGTKSYWGGITISPEDERFRNIETRPTKEGIAKYVNLGKTLATDIKAKPGDIITVWISELVPSSGKLGWMVPRVQDIDQSRSVPYAVNQVIGFAKRGRAWQARTTEASPTGGEGRWVTLSGGRRVFIKGKISTAIPAVPMYRLVQEQQKVVTTALSKLPEEHIKDIAGVYGVEEPDGAYGTWLSDGTIYLNTYHERNGVKPTTLYHEVGHNVLGKAHKEKVKEVEGVYVTAVKATGLSWEELRRKIQDGEEIKGFPSSYAASETHEFFAESYWIYVLDPTHLMASNRTMYNLLKDDFFDGKEYT